jgi:hypothetical protein
VGKHRRCLFGDVLARPQIGSGYYVVLLDPGAEQAHLNVFNGPFSASTMNQIKVNSTNSNFGSVTFSNIAVLAENSIRARLARGIG